MPQELWFWAALVPVFGVYWGLPPTWRRAFLALASVGWVAWLAPSAAALVLLAGLTLYGATAGGRVQGRLVGVFAAALVVLLLGFKLRVASGVLVPLGLSYATFKLVHFAVERVRGTLAQPDVATFVAWLFLFPTFTAGPIERLDHFVQSRPVDLERAAVVEGGSRIVHGVIKRFVFVEILSLGRTPLAALLADLDAWSAPRLLAWLFGAFLIGWMDFSAYSDLAIGASRLFGLRVAENFDWPILASSVGDYWKRNHRTLSAWCQAYVYLPTLGATRNPFVATFATFFVMGMWHGCSWPWLGWGLWHATGVSVALVWARFQRRRRRRWSQARWFQPIGHGLTLGWLTASQCFVVVSGSANAGRDALRLLGHLVGL